MRHAIIVNSLDDFEAFRTAQGRDRREFDVFTLSPTACLECRQAGVPARTISEAIPAVDVEGIYAKAFKETTRIIEVSSAAQGEGTVRLARLFKYYYWELLTDVYALDTVLSLWKNGQDISPYYIWRRYQPPARHVQIADPWPLAAHAFKVSHLNGWIKPVPVSAPFAAEMLDLPRTWTAGLRRSIGRIILPLLRRKSTKASDFPAGKRAIAWGSDYDALIVIPEVVKIAGEAGLKPLWVTEGFNAGTNRTGLVYRESYDPVDRFALSRYVAGQPSPWLSPDERRQVERAYNGLLSAIDGLDVGEKYHLSDLLRRLRPEYAENLLLARRMDNALRQWSGSTLVLTNFNGAQERIIEQLAPRYDIKVHAKIHGWLSNPEGYEYEAARYIVPGPLQVAFARKFFGYGEQVVAQPDLNLTRVADEWLNRSDEQRKAIAEEKRLSLGIKSKYVVVVLAARARNRIMNELNYTVFESCWLAILDYLKDHQELHVAVKSHPRGHYNPWLLALVSRQGVRNISVLSGPLEDVLGWADLVVDLGFPGTALIVTLLFGKPLLLYRGLYKYSRPFSDITHEAGRSFTVDSPAALLAEWDRMIKEGDAYLRSLEDRNRVLREGLT
jgi:hypothetical protein